MASHQSKFAVIDHIYQETARETADMAETAINWKPNRQELLVIVTLAIVCLLVALDASVIVTSLGVCINGVQRSL